MCCLPDSIRVFENCPKRTIEELKHIYSLNVTKIFGDAKALELLQCYGREYCSGSLTDQYVQLHEQIGEFMVAQAKGGSTLTPDDIDDFEGLPSALERQLRDVVAAKHDGMQKDQMVKECLKRIQESLCNDIETRREFVLFKLGIKKALKPYCRV